MRNPETRSHDISSNEQPVSHQQPGDLQVLLGQFNEALPLSQAHTIPAGWYTNEHILELEQRAVFGRRWQFAARTDQLSRVGQFVTTTVAGEPLIVVRSADGKLRAFSNVCRHRAARILREPVGEVTRLRCQYHGWTYDLAGHLRGTPEWDGVENFSAQSCSLPEFAVAVWGPAVFVNLSIAAATATAAVDSATDHLENDLHQHLSPMPEQSAGFNIAGLQFVERREYRLACNWKVYVDNYLDGGYHVNTIHPELAGVLDYAQYRTECHAWTSLQSSPLTTGGGTGETGIASVRTGNEAQYWWVYPNLMLNLYSGVMDTNLVLPDGPDHCRVIFDFYFADPDAPGRRAMIAESIAVSDRIQQEDVGVCEDVQSGLHSRHYDTGRFSVKREAGGYHFHRLLAADLRRG